MCTVSADELIVEMSDSSTLRYETVICGAYPVIRNGHLLYILAYDDRQGAKSMGLRPDLALGLLQFLQLNEERLREAVQDAD